MRQPRWLCTTLGALLAMSGAIVPAWAGKLIVIANDGKEPHRDGSYSVRASPQPYGVVILDASTKVGHPEGKSGVTGVAISPDGQWALATKRFDNSVALLRIDGTRVTYIAERDVFEVRSGPRTGDIAVGSNPRAVAMAPNGRWAAVGNIGLNSGDTDSVSIIDMTRTPPQGVDIFPVGQRPEAVAISPDGQWLAVGVMNGSNKRLDSKFRNEYSKILLYAMHGATATKVGEARGGKNQQGVIFTPDGQYILGQNYEEGEVAAYQVTPTGPQDTGWRLQIKGAFPAAIATAPQSLH